MTETKNESKANTKEEMSEILKELRTKMSEIDKLTQELNEKKKEFDGPPKKTKKLLEEIQVPSLEMLK